MLCFSERRESRRNLKKGANTILFFKKYLWNNCILCIQYCKITLNIILFIRVNFNFKLLL